MSLHVRTPALAVRAGTLATALMVSGLAPIAPAQGADSESLAGSYAYTAQHYSGELTIAPGEAAGTVDMTISTVLEGMGHLCGLEMTGVPAGADMRWTAPEDWMDCTVTVSVAADGALSVAGTGGCRSFCGMNGAFEGRYAPQ